MHQFKDNEGREWSLAMNIAQAKRIKASIHLDFVDDGFGAVQAIADSIGKAVDVIWLLCERQATERGLSDEQFGEALTGDVIDAALQALLEEITDFFPPRHRGPMRKILSRMQEMTTRAAAMAERKMESQETTNLMTSILAQAETEVDRQLAALTAGSSSGNVPASPA